MTNSDQITEKRHSIKIELEKLDGGYVSNATGKRSIYKDAGDILDVLDMTRLIGKLDNDEYHMDILIVPKDEYQDMTHLAELHTNEELTLESAKSSGIIEEVEKFNPLPKMEEPDLTAPIKVTLANAYNSERLKNIPWAELHEQLPLLPSEITKITGMNTTTLYASLPKARNKKMSFQHSSARIGFTILAQYYEKTLGIRTSTKDQCEKMKEDMLKLIREVEVIYSGKPFVKVADISPKLIEMRKTLL